MCGATDGPRRTDFSAANVPGETNFSATDVPGGLVLGGTNFCVTGLRFKLASRSHAFWRGGMERVWLCEASFKPLLYV